MTLPFDFARVSNGRVFVISNATDFDRRYAIGAGGEQALFGSRHGAIDALVGPGNLLLNGDFSEGIQHWEAASSLPASVFFSTDFSDDTRLAGSTTAYVTGHSGIPSFTLVYTDPLFGDTLPVLSRRTYRFDGLFAAHRAVASVDVAFLDETSRVISTLSQSLTEHRGGPERSDWQRVSITGVPPSGSHSARLSIRFLRSQNAVRDMNFFLFFTDLSFAVTEGSDLEDAGRGWNRSLLAMAAGRSASRLFEAAFDIEAVNRTRSSIDLIALDPTKMDRIVLYDTVAALHDVSARITLEGGRLIHVGLKGSSSCILFCDHVQLPPPVLRTGDNVQIFELPRRLLDGEPHLFDARDSAGITLLARDYIVLPNSATPWRILQDHAGPRLPSHLAPAACDRYRALERHLEHGLGERTTAELFHAHQVVSAGFDVNRDFTALRFTEHARPTVTIVIPVHNKFEVTYFCLCALLLAFNKASFEVVVVDDGSSDRTEELGKFVSGIRIVRNEAALGFIGACNRGAETARGAFIVFLNNDTEPTAGWLDALIESFELFENVGMAGSKLVYPDGSLQEAGGIVWGNGNPWNYGRSQNAHDPRYTYTRDADYLSGAAIMLPAKVWAEAGGFSTELMPAYFEDVDLAFKVRDRGYRTLYVASSVVYHFEGVTSGTSVLSGAKRNQEINRPKFKAKWVNAYRGHGKEGVDPDLEKDRGVAGRVLFVDYQTPKPDSDAGSYAAVQEMRLVRSLGYKVYFFPQNAAYLGRHTEYLQRLGIETLHAPFYQSIDDVMQQIGHHFDVVYMIRYYVAQHCFEAVRRWAPQAKLVMNNCDLHFLRELRAGIANGDPGQIERATQIRDEELAAMREVDLTLSYNDVEHAVIMSHNRDKGRVMRVPWVETLTKTVPAVSDRSGIAFLGSFNHPPNKEAVFFFIGKVMPILRHKGFPAAFSVYGSNVSKDVEAMATDDVTIEGYVRDLSDVYDRCRVFVAPLTSGAGIKGKVLGALAHGTPCVLSPIAAEGIGLRHGYDCWIAETPAEWAEAVERLSTDADLWNAFSQRGRDLIQTNYSFESGLVTMRKAFQSLGLFTP